MQKLTFAPCIDAAPECTGILIKKAQFAGAAAI